MARIFVSYRRADSSMLAALIAKDLKAKGITVFVDTRSVDGAGPFPTRLLEAIEDADVFVCLLGATTLDSEWVRKEIEHAHAKNKPMIPVFQEKYLAPNPVPNTAIEALLQSDGVHIFDIKHVFVDEAIKQLAEMVTYSAKSIHLIKRPNWEKWVAIATILGVLIAACGLIINAISPIIAEIIGAQTAATLQAIGNTPAETIEVVAVTISPIPITPTPEPPQTPLELALDRATNFTGTNEDWKNWYPDGFVQEFNGVEMVLVPKGCFMMGSDEGDDDEQPVHEQCFDAPFWIDKTEVTNAQFRSVGCEHTSSEPNQPLNCVSWFEARNFCVRRETRLPTEREWEYAARGVSKWEYPWGDEFISDNVVYGSNSGGKTAVVGSRLAGVSWVGALDMSGNVWEWVNSLYVDYEYNIGKSESDINITNPRVLRGGSFDFNIVNQRAANRNRFNPNGSSLDWGFRCTRDVDA
jgi:formylglycine-generating enzyme required for sulfatase activity